MLNLRQYFPGIIILVVSVIISLFIFKDYGLSWDEPWQRDIGYVTYNYIYKGDKSLDTYDQRDHGVGVDLPLIIVVENILGLSDFRDIFLIRKILQSMSYLFCMFVAYVFLLKLFKKQLVAVLGFLILVYTPHLYAHSFLNQKDIPFMCMYLLSLIAIAWAFKKDRAYAFLIAGIIIGYATSIRLLGIVLIPCIAFFLLVDVFLAWKQKGNLRRKMANFALSLIGFSIVLYLCWPALWKDPVNSFLDCFRSFSHYVWDYPVLFLGEIRNASKLPRTYLPVWFTVTTPVLWLLLGITAIVMLLVRFVRDPLRSLTADRFFILSLMAFLGPVLLIVILHSVIYDGWRHLYFVYAPFVFLILYAINKLLETKARHFVIVLCILQLASVSFFMIKYHPHQQVYFNEAVPKHDNYLRKNFELDYWGCSTKQALEFILANDSSKEIFVNNEYPILINTVYLPHDQRNRIKLAQNNEKIDYHIWFFRTHELALPKEKKVFEIKVSDNTITSVYKLKK